MQQGASINLLFTKTSLQQRPATKVCLEDGDMSMMIFKFYSSAQIMIIILKFYASALCSPFSCVLSNEVSATLELSTTGRNRLFLSTNEQDWKAGSKKTANATARM